MRSRSPFLVALLVLLVASPAAGQDVGRNRNGDVLDLLPADAVSGNVLATPDGDVRYRATAGTMDLFGTSGTRNAKIYYTAYVADGGDADRPVTFAFNGGPGAASDYLHLGMVGPRVVDLDPDDDDGTTPVLKPNPDSWLAFTDLVLIDPVGTGWSRGTGGDLSGTFYGVRQDAASLAKFIALYVQKTGRIGSEKYLLGESYGGFRAAKVALSLKDTQGILVSGIVMVSPMIDWRLIVDADEDPLVAALHLPSLAAAELERRGLLTPARVTEAERFAMTDYLVAMAGAPPAGEAGERFHARVADMTGVPVAAVEEARGFVAGLAGKHAGGAGRVVSPYDAARSAPDAHPERPGDHNSDLVLDGYTRAYAGAFASYARNDLRFETELTYTLLNDEVNRRWDWERGRSSARASDDLRELLSVIPSFRLAVLHGYSDVLTPFGASRYVLDHLPRGLAEGRTALSLYRGGHMFYADPASRRAAAEDARRFFEGAAPPRRQKPS